MVGVEDESWCPTVQKKDYRLLIQQFSAYSECLSTPPCAHQTVRWRT